MTSISEKSSVITISALEQHGVLSFSCPKHVTLTARDRRLFTIGEGTSEIQRLIVARQVWGA